MFSTLRLLNSAVKRTGTEIQFSAFTKFGNWINLKSYCTLSTDTSGKKEKQAPVTKTTKTLPKQYKFISVGHILLDYTARLPANEIDILHKFHIPYNTKGELDVQTLRKLKDEACRKVECVESPGGSALNTVRILTQLGESALFIGAVGDDEAARKLRKHFREHNIDVRLFTQKELPTGECMAIINRDTQGEALYANIGASAKISMEHMKQAEQELHFLRPTERKQIIYLEGFILPRCKELCHYMVTHYLSGRRWLALNLSAEYIVRNNFHAIMKFACMAYFIFGNGREFCALADKMGFGRDIDKAIKMIFEQHAGPCIVIITNAERGLILVSNVEYGSAKPGKLIYRHCRVDRIDNVIDTTGAGDSFVAGFLHAFLNNYKLKDCVIVGTAVAAQVVTKIGCNLPSDFNVKSITDKMKKIK